MERVLLSEVRDLVAYEKVRDSERARIIKLKKNRRISVGDNLTFLFENRETVLFQVQEMVRTERIVEKERIQEELDAYNALIPDPLELSATLFIELPGLSSLPHDEVRERVNRFQGLDRDGVVTLEVGDSPFPARFEGGHSKEEKMAAVHYLRFPLDERSRKGLGEAAVAVRIRVDHPHYKAVAQVGPALRAEMLADLG
jgi:hypothetical protein